jgi:hypothetical protein
MWSSLVRRMSARVCGALVVSVVVVATAAVVAAPAHASSYDSMNPAPYGDPSYASALETFLKARWPNPYQAAESALASSDALTRNGLHRARIRGGVLPPIWWLNEIFLQPNSPGRWGWWVRRYVAGNWFDQKYLLMEGNLGQRRPGDQYALRYRWKWDALSGQYRLRYSSYWGWPVEDADVFFNPDTCGVSGGVQNCFPHLYGSDRDAAYKTFRESWKYYTEFRPPGTVISAPCGSYNASGCLR